MNNDELKESIQEILKVVDICPKELQAKCFELLLLDYLAANKPARIRTTQDALPTPSQPSPVLLSSEAELPPETARRMRVFASANGLSVDQILKTYHVDELGNVSIEAIDLKAAKTAKRQRRLALLLGGKYHFQAGSFDVPTEELRELCVTYGAYDAANFMANLKNSREILAGFKPEGTNKLSPLGKAELGGLLKELTA